MGKKVPLRMCVGCKEMKEKKQMIRVVKTAENAFVLDATGKMNGRGAYLCKNSQCLQMAMKNHGLERSFKTQIPKETVAVLQKEMETIGE